MRFASTLPTALALAAIRFYRRRLSPYKGFSCALSAGTGGASCSAYGYTVIARFGLKRGLGLLDRRLALCGHVHRRMAPLPRPAPVHPRRKYQQGFCDGPCDLPCDGPGHCHFPCDGHHHGGGAGKALMECACNAFTPCDGCSRKDCDTLKRWRETRRGPRTRNPQHLDAAAERIRRQQARKREEQNPRRPRS